MQMTNDHEQEITMRKKILNHTTLAFQVIDKIVQLLQLHYAMIRHSNIVWMRIGRILIKVDGELVKKINVAEEFSSMNYSFFSGDLPQELVTRRKYHCKRWMQMVYKQRREREGCKLRIRGIWERMD
jgi:hypothetical protein